MSGADHIPSAARVAYSFPRSVRLLQHAAFDRVYREGRRLFAPDLTVFVRRREGEAATGPRIGFTVSRALGNAVTRNRIKRRLRAAARREKGRLQGPLDVVVNPKKSVLQTGFILLRQQMERAFAQVQRPDFSFAVPPRNGSRGDAVRTPGNRGADRSRSGAR